MLKYNENNDNCTIFIKPVGNICNLKCIYCYEKNKHDKSNILDAKEINSFLEKYKDSNNIFIVFHGGEPLLMDIKIAEDILEYIHYNFSGNYSVQFQTNGTLINDKWCKFFSKYSKISVSISLDPPGEIDMRYSDSKYRQLLYDNINLLSKYVSNIGVISVLHRYNCNEELYKFIDTLINMKIHSLTINKVRVSPDSGYYINELEYVNMLDKLIKYWIANKLYKKISIQPLNSFFNPKGNRLCMFLNNCNKCKSFITFNGNSNVINNCEHFVEYKKYDSCEECDLIEFCGEGCISSQKDEVFCEARRKLWLLVEGIKNGNKTFIN